MALVGRGWLRRLIPCCNGVCSQLSSPGRAAHSSRDKKAVWPPSSTLFRPCRCSGRKPLPSTSHRGRDGRGFDKLEGNASWPTSELSPRLATNTRARSSPCRCSRRTSASSPKTATTKTRRRTGSSSAARKSAPPGPRRSNEGRDYLSVKLDDPSFTAPIFANLFDDEDGKSLQPDLVARAPQQRRLTANARPARHLPGGASACSSPRF
jgi:hypothetical protein